MTVTVSIMEGLIIANSKYTCDEHDDLEYPEKDGELMKNLLTDGGYTNTVVEENEEDIASIVKSYVKNQQKTLERFHFHYSGFDNNNI